MAGVTAAQLQAEHDELQRHMPALPFTILPSSLAASLLSVHETDAGAAARVLKTAPPECQVCSCGTGSSAALQLLLSTQLDFGSRSVQVKGARLACAQCAAVSRASLLLQVGSAVPGAHSRGDGHQQQLQQLMLHAAAVNSAPSSVTGNPDALAVWVQELACRAHSLATVANSLSGWCLQPAPSSWAQLLKRCLLPHKHSSAPVPAPHHAKQQHATKKRQQAAPEPAAQPATPRSSSKRQRKAAAAAAAASGGPAPQQAGVSGPKQGGKQGAHHPSPKDSRKQREKAAHEAAPFKTPQAAGAKKKRKSGSKQLLMSAPH
jgi:hypothetical protein